MDFLEPGTDIRPHLSQQMATALAHRLYGLNNVQIKELNGYDDKNYHIQTSDDNQNSVLWPHGYVLKVLNSLDSQKLPLIEAQTDIALYLGARDINCPQPVKNLSGEYYSLEEIQNGNKNQRHVVRMLTFQPGELLNQVPCTSHVMFKLGKFIGEMDQALKGFHNDVFKKEKSLWSLESFPLIRKFMFAVQDAERNALVNTIIGVFEREVIPMMINLEKGIIHGDVNDQNVVLGPDATDGSWKIAAILDFGDTQFSCCIFELAVNICYMILIAADMDPMDAGGYIIAGYSTIRQLPDTEFNILKTCICARLCQSLVMGAYSYMQDPGNKYLLNTAQKGWTLLELMWNEPNNNLIDRWRRIVAMHQIRN